MDWQNKIIAPKRHKPPKVRIRYPCPALSRFSGMASFLVVGLGIYYGGTAFLGLEPLDWAAPVWTAKHVGLVAAGILLGALGGLLGFAFAMTIEVRNERLSDLFIVLWQFLANGGLVWVMAIGTAMSVSLGKEEAKAAVIHFGAERILCPSLAFRRAMATQHLWHRWQILDSGGAGYPTASARAYAPDDYA